MTNRQLKYVFQFEDKTNLEFELNFDTKHNYIKPADQELKEWTKLDNLKCASCPLKSSDSPHCPVAVNLDYVVESTKDMISHSKAKVEVITPDRSYMKDTDTQDGLLSLFGLIMATSGCPHLDWFKPLARFHLPFSTVEDTLFRVLSLHFVEEYLHSDGEVTLGIAKIKDHYAGVEAVNKDFIKRIQDRCKGDADLNAIVALDLFAKLFKVEYEDNFDGIKEFFERDDETN